MRIKRNSSKKLVVFTLVCFYFCGKNVFVTSIFILFGIMVKCYARFF